jgi:hypothetical protein
MLHIELRHEAEYDDETEFGETYEIFGAPSNAIDLEHARCLAARQATLDQREVCLFVYSDDVEHVPERYLP